MRLHAKHRCRAQRYEIGCPQTAGPEHTESASANKPSRWGLRKAPREAARACRAARAAWASSTLPLLLVSFAGVAGAASAPCSASPDPGPAFHRA